MGHKKVERAYRFAREICLTGALSDDQRARLLEIAGRCPVHRTLEGEAELKPASKPPGRFRQ